MARLIFSLIIFAQLAGAAPVKKPKANVDERKAQEAQPAPIVLTHDAPNFCIFGGQSGNSYAGEAAFTAIVWSNDVVYVGETQDQPLDHLAQFEALKAMRIARGSKMAVGFEMLNLTLQPVLDDYAAGRITEEEFLNKADWKTEWGFDFAMYKPVFDLIVENKLRALALSVPKKVAAKIARGGLAALDADERKFLPEKVEVSAHKKYNEYLRKVFDGQGASPAAKLFTFENYRASMAAWNEGMGARIADFLGANPGYSVLVLAGNGHLAYNAAIQASVKSRTKGLRQASFYTASAAACPKKMPDEHKNLAGYMWYINHAPRPDPAALPATAAPAAMPAPVKK